MGAELVGALKLLLAVQASQAALAGTIRDGESGKPLAGAAITLTDVGRTTVSDSAGRYRLAEVPSGPQHLSVKRIGYSPRTLHALVPGGGELEIDLSLHPVPLQLPTIVVRSSVPVRGLEPGDSTPFPDRGISALALRNHPLLAEPDGFLALSGGEIAMAPEAPSGVHIRGGAPDQTAYLLDGVPVFSPYHAAGTFSAWNPDALDRLQVLATTPSLAPTDALAGAVAAATRAPGTELRSQGTLSTSHGGVTMHGPLGTSGAGFLLSARSGFPGIVAPRRDPSYLRGHTGDLLAKVETPAFGGRLRVLGYDSGNELDASAVGERPDSTTTGHTRNGFEWHSRSLGIHWSRPVGNGFTLRVQGWNARGEAEAAWSPAEPSGFRLESDREDQGFLAAVERSPPGRFTGAGIRVERSRTFYRAAVRDSAGSGTSLDARTPIAAVFARHRRPVAPGLSADLALSATGATGDVHLGLQSELRWRPSPAASISGSYVRSHQFSQSLRNSESVVGGIFPADLYIGAGAPGIPVARSDRVVIGAELLARAGVRLGAQAYLSAFDGVLLVAPQGGNPFATGGLRIGGGASRGLSLIMAMSRARYGVTASYGWQRVRVTYGDSSFTPGYGTSHLIEAGVIVFPAPTASIRLGLNGAVGRRATGILGAFEWESCNLLDRGCEFGGTPMHDSGRLGATKLPAYFRLDLGLRKHWHLQVAGRDLELALFGTVTNLLGRRNILAVATDQITGQETAIELRPLAPLVVGLDWRF